MLQQAIRSKHIVCPDGVRSGVIVINDGKISAIAPDNVLSCELKAVSCELKAASSEPKAVSCELKDVGDLWLLPGLTDVHVHINEPGRTEWEGFETASRAAAAGGYTCLVDMPLNCIPSTTNVAALNWKKSAAEGKSCIDLAFWGAVVPGNTEDIQPLADAGVRGFKCFLTHPGTEDFQHVSEDDLRRAMPRVAATGLPLLAHAELPGPLDRAQEQLEKGQPDWTRYRTYLQSRPPEAELEAIRLLIRLCRQTGCRTHIVHLSAAEALPEIRSAKNDGLPLTVETCPHYLFFSAEDIPDGATEFKCAPPIRGRDNREALWQGLRDGVIDLIGTDHSPCPPAMKCRDTGDFRSAWGGISSLSMGLSAVWTAASQRGFSLNDVIRWMAESPVKLAGLDSRKGRIAAGFDADLVAFDPASSFEVTTDRLYFRHACTPYLGVQLQGEVKWTMTRGRTCFPAKQL